MRRNRCFFGGGEVNIRTYISIWKLFLRLRKSFPSNMNNTRIPGTMARRPQQALPMRSLVHAAPPIFFPSLMVPRRNFIILPGTSLYTWLAFASAGSSPRRTGYIFGVVRRRVTSLRTADSRRPCAARPFRERQAENFPKKIGVFQERHQKYVQQLIFVLDLWTRQCRSVAR